MRLRPFQRAVLFPLLAACAGALAQPAPDRLQTTGDAVIGSLKRGDLATVEALFSRQMKAIYPHEKFVETWAQITKEVGALDHCDAPKRETLGKIVSMDYPCTFERATMRLRVAINPQNRLEALKNDQVVSLVVKADEPVVTAEPVAPSPYPTEEVTVGASGWPLPATFTSPTKGGRTPIVVFVHDFGPHDRDETIGGVRMFRDLADGLAARGIASLRYDKRSFALPKRFATELKNWTVNDEAIDDAVAALAYAASRPNAGPLIVVGHGFGGRLAPRIASAAAAKNIAVDAVVMIASSLTPVEDTLVEEVEFQSELPQPMAKSEAVDDIRKRRDNVKRLINVSSDTPQVETTAPLYPGGYPASAWRELANYDPGAALLTRTDLPALLVFGGRDYQTPLREKRYWQQRLVGRRDTLVTEFPAVNHLLVEGRGLITPAEYSRPGHVADEVMDRIASWINQRPRSAR